MPSAPRSYELLQRVVDAYHQSSNVSEAARSIDMPRTTFVDVLADARERGMLDEPTPVIAPTVDRLTLPAEEMPIPEPAPEAGGPSLPEPIPQSYDPYTADTAGHWGVLCDPHLPYHDKNTIIRWADDCKARGVKGILLNGDVLDCYQLSSHHKDPTKARFREEVECGQQFLRWLRAKFPTTRIIYKEGNHDERLRRYIAERAPALFDLPELDLRVILGLDNLGIEWVPNKRVINLGKLPVVHGHEFRGGGGVMPARWLYLRAGSTALCGHFHRTSEHHETTLTRRHHAVWSVGCACFLYPQYDPNNKWNAGYALVEVFQDQTFSVTNRRILRDGTVV